ncbi:MAG: hypothetical protein KZQ90_13670 [Candidatus Thiodiazotropha sp. (ex Codakia rugifera)]|nr:hypothetical protein [Candidatus Thiodiazotropha sp. (ex Codakia rugifera)]
MDSDKLQRHVLATYKTLRYGLATIAVFFPVLLVVGGRISGIPVQDSMSAYYFASCCDLEVPAMRVWVIGLLFSIGILLVIYRGFSYKENLALNFAGICAIGVAYFPMPWGCLDDCPTVSMHYVSAILLFASIAYVCVFCANETLSLINDEMRCHYYYIKYRSIGAVMILSPIVALTLTFLINEPGKYILLIECIGIWTFAYFWWTKSQELSESEAEFHALSCTRNT